MDDSRYSRYRRLDECLPGCWSLGHHFSTSQADIVIHYPYVQVMSLGVRLVHGPKAVQQQYFWLAFPRVCYGWKLKSTAELRNTKPPSKTTITFWWTSSKHPEFPPNSKGATAHHQARKEPRSNFFRLSSRLFSSRLYIHRDWKSAINADHVSWILPCGDEPLELDQLDKVTSTEHFTNFFKGTT